MCRECETLRLELDLLKEKVRKISSDKELLMIVGPSASEELAAQQRLKRLETIAPRCRFDKFQFQCSPNERLAREQYARIMDEQTEFENRYL